MNNNNESRNGNNRNNGNRSSNHKKNTSGSPSRSTNAREKFGNYVASSNHQSNDAVAQALEKARQNQKKNIAKKAIRTGLNSVAPGTGEIADRMLKTEKGKELLDAYAKGSSDTEGLKNVAVKIKEQTKKKMLIFSSVGVLAIVLFIAILLVGIFKNADTQIYSNVNDGNVDPEQYPDYDPINPNVFVKYPGIYEKVEAATKKVSNKYKVDIDKYLILATLIAPIENGNIMPTSDQSCGETDCYYFQGKSYTWEKFLDLWGDQAELLAKSQILTYVNESSDIDVTCGDGQTVEDYAKNDQKVNEFNFWKLFNPANWFSGFRDATDAETNAKCIMDVPYGVSSIPTVYVLSKEQGTYYNSINAAGERIYEKDGSTGGVYFWNLVNNGGFIHVYFKDYLNINEGDSDDQNYEKNLATILDIGNYIYSYYESIRKDCDGYLVIESTIENIKVSDGNGGYTEVPLEEYVGGVILAEFNSGNEEAEKAFAVLARSYAVSYVGTDGSGVILNSSAAQNYNPDYSPEKYPKIAKYVEDTKGLVVTKFGTSSVKRTEYDAFCPTSRELMDGYWYLPDTQNYLPINPEAYYKKTGANFTISEDYLMCPCFQNVDSRPANSMSGGKRVRWTTLSGTAPTSPAGNPRQATEAICWTDTGTSRVNEDTFLTEYAWSYKPSGGHGRGASQHGLRYYGVFDYEWEALIKLFFEDASIKRLQSSLEEGECQNASLYKGGEAATIDSCGVTFEVSDSNYTKSISGNPLNQPLVEALDNAGYTVECLNDCISQRTLAAGMGTREAVVEAAVGLLECTMEMTGGFTYPYDHRGGYPQRNPDINGKLGINTRWGEYEDWATGCGSSKCRLGLNCANFVRWSMCNGGMDLCSKGSTFATGMAGVNSDSGTEFFPGAIRIYLHGSSFSADPDITIGALSSGYKEKFGAQYNDGTKLSAVNIDKVLSLIQPGDVLYSDVNGGSNHVMVIVGVEDSAIWIAENGRKTRLVTYDDLKSGSKNYVVLLLDSYYENGGNGNSLSW